MKKLSFFTILLTAVSTAFYSCNDSSTIGSSISQDLIEVVMDSNFTVTGHSKPIDKIQSRSVSQLIGRIDAPGYGYLSSNVVTQFMASSRLDSTLTSAADIDSLVLYMYMANGDFVGDSIVPMGMNIYRLTQNLPSPIYSNFNPEGYYDPNDILASKIYNISNESLKLSGDTIFSSSIELSVKLPIELAVEFFDAYQQNPNNFSSPTAFSENVFKGIYIENSFGSGRLLRAQSTMMSLYYHYYVEDEDSTYNAVGNYFAVTPEIITNNDLKYEMSQDLQARVDEGQQLVAAPVGLEIEMEFPAIEIINSYKSHGSSLAVLNALTFEVPVSGITNEYNFNVPTYMLMVLSKDKDQFFAKNSLPDNITSFYATYNSTGGYYSFGDMKNYIKDLLDKETISPEDYTFTLVPVSATFESSSSSYYYSTTQTLSMITPYIAAPVMAQLHLDEAEVVLTYSTQAVNK